MIWIEDTQIKVGNIVLPGLLKSIEVSHEAEIDEQEVEGSSKKKKQATGYSDARINIELILEQGVCETAEYKLVKLQNLFKKAGQDKPIVYNIISGHLVSRGISKVLFKSLSSKEDNRKSCITATLEFIEYNAMTITAEKASTSQTAAASNTNTAVKQTSAVSAAKKGVSVAVTIASRGSSYQRGAAPKLSEDKKTAKSPAKDNSKNGRDMAKQVRQKSQDRR